MKSFIIGLSLLLSGSGFAETIKYFNGTERIEVTEKDYRRCGERHNTSPDNKYAFEFVDNEEFCTTFRGGLYKELENKMLVPRELVSAKERDLRAVMIKFLKSPKFDEYELMRRLRVEIEAQNKCSSQGCELNLEKSRPKIVIQQKCYSDECLGHQGQR